MEDSNRTFQLTIRFSNQREPQLNIEVTLHQKGGEKEFTSTQTSWDRP